ncbi:AI-2E family transporter [Psychromonas sp. KJ10-10]|uniref:AI-2E family transporter n=1 Tax=Psychromonas sp. KJ10-10 TaxID=3391823 RepID=UPI0039B47189
MDNNIVKPQQADHSNIKSLYVAGFWFLFSVSILAIFYFAKSILLPIIISTFIALLCSPLVNYLVKIKIPRQLGVVSIIFIIVAILSSGANLFTEPAQQWWNKLPTLVKDLSHEVTNATESTIKSSGTDDVFVNQTNVGEFQSNTVISLIKSIAIATPTVITQLMMSLFMVYFLLSYGRSLFIGMLMQFDGFSNKRKTVELARTIQRSLSRYISTVTLINMFLGLIVGSILFFSVSMTHFYGGICRSIKFCTLYWPSYIYGLFWCYCLCAI